MRKSQDTDQLVKMLRKLQRLSEQELTRIEPLWIFHAYPIQLTKTWNE